MCEIFGRSASEAKDINDDLKEFFSHCVDHPHGWGMALFYDSNAVSIEKEPISAGKSIYLKERLSRPIEIADMMAHIRFATVGVMEYSNTHPYVYRDISGRNWTMIHNGTIFEYPVLSKYIPDQEGNTDSERILMYIVDKIDENTQAAGRDLTDEERFNILDEIISDMSKGNKLNLIICDSSQMYVHTNCRDTLYLNEEKNGIEFCTKPLRRGRWDNVPFTQLLAYSKGKLKFEGSVHGNEYVEDPEVVAMLYREFSQL